MIIKLFRINKQFSFKRMELILVAYLILEMRYITLTTLRKPTFIEPNESNTVTNMTAYF